MSADLADFGYD